MENLKIQVFGKVQGVFFRKQTKETAEELNLKGWVKNETNGSVLIEAEGDKKSLEKFIEWCHKGPALANVTNVHVVGNQPLKEYKVFTILKD